MQKNSGCCREDCSNLLPLPEALDRSFGLRCDVLLAFSVETGAGWWGGAPPWRSPMLVDRPGLFLDASSEAL